MSKYKGRNINSCHILYIEIISILNIVFGAFKGMLAHLSSH